MFKNMLEKKSILIVEDDLEMAKNFAELLRYSGFATLIAKDVYDAYKKLVNQKFHLIIVDMQLGEHTGERVINVIRKDLCGLNIRSPVMICSGNLDSSVFMQIRYYVDDVLIKPVEAKDILEKAKFWTERQSNIDYFRQRAQTKRRRQILIADDDVDITDNLELYLKSMDYNIVTCYDYISLKHKLELQKFDCILIDRHINQQDSSDLIKDIRSDISTPNNKTPMVMMTSDLSEDFIRVLGEDVQGFMYKPFNLSEVPQYLNNILKKLE